MLASRPADVEAVQGQREDSRVPGFDTELRRQLRRAGVADGDVVIAMRTDAAGRPEIVVTITERPRTIFLALTGAESMTVRATGAAIALYST